MAKRIDVAPDAAGEGMDSRVRGNDIVRGNDVSTAEAPFSGVFTIPAGEMLALKAELADQLLDMVGKSFFEVRAAAGIRGSNRNVDLAMTDDGFACISLIGPVTRYDDICSSLFGGVSVESLSAEISAAMDDPACKGILLSIDSPGGQAAGIYDLADMLWSCDKPIVAYVDNCAASAAYWVASACDQIVMSPAGFVGSIGVVCSIYNRADANTIELVSSKSPKKRPDVSTDEGRQQLQDRIDAMADVFIGAVARHRGVEADTVESDFGQGDMVIAEKAVSSGMADSMGNISDAVNELRRLSETDRRDWERSGALSANGGPNMADKTQAEETKVLTAGELLEQYPEAAGALVKQSYDKGMDAGRLAGAESERVRISGIDELDTAANRAVAGAIITAAKADGKTTAEQLALSILKAQGEKQTSMASAMREDSAALPVIKDSPEAAGGGEDEKQQQQKLSAELGAAMKAARQ